MGKTVISNVEQLKNSGRSQLELYKRHFDEYSKNQSLLKGLYLLKFYAVECGLKAFYLRKNSLRDTSYLSQVNGEKYGHGHDLEMWVKELKLPAFLLKSLKDSSVDYPISTLHQRLRYGSSMPQEQLNAQIGFLKELTKILKDARIL